MQADLISDYRRLRAAGRRPALLESLGVPTTFGRRTLLGRRAVRTLEVRGGGLYDDGVRAGSALDLFDVLELPPGETIFPCWIGFLAYEFAQHLGLPTLAAMPGLPEASFSLYEEGSVWEDGVLVEGGGGAAAGGGRPPAAAAPPPPLPPLELHSDYPPEEFIAGVDEVQERIRAGWVYQVNLSHRFRFDAARVDPLTVYLALRAANPSPFMGIIEGDGWAVVSGSPERLFDARGGVVTARPIAGTRPRAAAPEADASLEAELRADRKEQAEHVMLVDLLRNDLSRVCEPGTVEVGEAFTVERYSHVMHLVSEVRGRRSGAATLRDLVASIFPGGTITGAPKESVMREIARLEPVPRGAYTGSMGYVSGAAVDLNILIRSLTFAGLEPGESEAPAAGAGYLSGGGGVVIESDPETEYLETRHKVEALLKILGKGKGGEAPAAPRPHHSWRPPAVPSRHDGARVLFVENHDSFSYNIVNYLRMLGAEVAVVDHGDATGFAGASHVVVGPGPGEPATAGRTLDWVRGALDAGLPYLGVCLGHQALGVLLGPASSAPPGPSTARVTRCTTAAAASSRDCRTPRPSRGTTRWSSPSCRPSSSSRPGPAKVSSWP